MRKRKKSNTNKGTIHIQGNNQSVEPPEDIVIGFKNRLKPRSLNQRDYIRTVAENTISFCQGVPGSGKTHIAVGMALEYLLDEQVKKIVITRPIVEAGEKLGFLPGSAEDKLHPYLLPLFDEIEYFLQMHHFKKLKSLRQIEIVPLGLMRGRSFHESFIIADECQNASYDQLKMLLTRIGIDSKMVLTGDLDQSDLQTPKQGGLQSIIERLQDIDGVGFSKLETSDIVRNPIIADIVHRL